MRYPLLSPYAKLVRFCVWPRWRVWLSAAGLSLGTIATSGVGQAAENIFFRYGLLERSVQVESLEILAEEGRVEPDLAFYFNAAGLGPEDIDTLRQNLDQPLDVDGVLLSRVLYTALGEGVLAQVGEIIRTRSGDNGKLALRAALVQAATSPEGLSALNVLKALPTEMQIDIADALAMANAVDQVVVATEDAVTQLSQLTATQATQESPVDYATLRDLTQPGGRRVQTQRLTLTDPERDRSFYVDVVRPRQWQGQAPVVVFSHGLTASPEDWQRWATHLASHGLVVVLPQHPGSDAQKVATFQSGLTNEIFEVQEFINRPLDISFVLDHLEQINATDFEGRLNLERVAVGGHSLGGYTALAVAGAELNLAHLETACNQRFLHINMSLVLQCQALQLPQSTYDFRDPRVAAVLLINPVNSSLFGPEGLAAVTVPVLIIAGSHDPAAPAVFEQFRTFPWYTTPSRSLALIEGQAHLDLSVLDGGLSNLLRSLPGLTLAEQPIVDRYMNALSLAFVGRYGANRPDYGLYLRANYATYLSQDQPFRLFMVNAGADIEQELVRPLEQQLQPLIAPPPPSPQAPSTPQR